MIRSTTRPTTARCNLIMYMGFLISEPKSSTCTRLSEVIGISHHSVNRFLKRELFEPIDLFNEVKNSVNLQGGTLSVDDSVLDKPYSNYMALVGYFWSGKHHRAVKGINLITLYYTDISGRHMPVNYRIYDNSEGKTKNDYFQDMLDEVLRWGLEPAFVTGDSWYSGVQNLKKVKKYQTGFMFAIKSNRTISLEKGKWQQVQTLLIPDDGLEVWLKDFGKVKIFRTMLKDEQRHYVIHLPDNDFNSLLRKDFLDIHDHHWQIEQYHRAIKQVCHIEHFQVRNEQSIRNHIFGSICSFVYLQKMQIADVISNIYKHQRELYIDVVAEFIKSFSKDKTCLEPKFRNSVNA